MRKLVIEKIKCLMEGENIPGHNIAHFINVADHAVRACEHEEISDEIKKGIEIAALLHDVDDHKIFPDNHNYENATKILNELNVNQTELIIEMIKLVSCSKNGGTHAKYNWMVIPRDCDRLEAIGKIGIDRCREYTIYKNMPFHTAITPRIYTRDDVYKIATVDRFINYTNGNPSSSMIDHYYDKLLHIGKPEYLTSGNKYILQQAEIMNNVIIDYILEYWNHNST